MKKNVWIASIVLVLALILNSCGTQQKATATVVTPVVQEPVVAVEPLKEVISIADALDMYQNPDKVDAITKKYGYKLKTNYEVYPKPMRKGVSSYVAFKDGAIIIAVFNQLAYDNLVAQVKAAGFTLDMPGSEDIYIKGNRTIACYKDGKSVRIQ